MPWRYNQDVDISSYSQRTKLNIIYYIQILLIITIMTLRKTTHSVPLVIGITLIATMVIAGGMAIITTKSVFAQGVEKKFTATLSGKNEVPAKDTKATGTSEFTISRDGKTMAHIHQGKTGENGPIVVTLFKATTATGSKNGILARGTITSDNLEGPLKGKQISDLVKLIEDGNAYANVHTQQNPKGEIRGEILK